MDMDVGDRIFLNLVWVDAVYQLNGERGRLMRIYVLKLPKSLGRFVKAMLGIFGHKN